MPGWKLFIPSVRIDPLACDICSGKPRRLRFYPHREFWAMGRALHAEQGGWAVCDDCAALIESQDLDRMVHRALERQPGLTVALAVALYSGFLRNRLGAARYQETRLDPARSRA